MQLLLYPPDDDVDDVVVVRGCPTKAATGATTTDSDSKDDWNFIMTGCSNDACTVRRCCVYGIFNSNELDN